MRGPAARSILDLKVVEQGEIMGEDLRRRSAEEVFEDHLRLAGEHRFEADIARNVAPDIVILERRGIFRGREGARELARLLEQELPDAPYTYTNRLVEGRVAFLEWTAEAETARVRDGADSFVIERGWIVAQTIHYTVEPTASRRAGRGPDPASG